MSGLDNLKLEGNIAEEDEAWDLFQRLRGDKLSSVCGTWEDNKSAEEQIKADDLLKERGRYFEIPVRHKYLMRGVKY